MKVASVLLVLFLAGCATPVIEPTYYLMRSNHDLPSGKLSPSTEFSIGSVDIASYMDQAGLLMETVDGQVTTAQQNLWAEPVYDGIFNYLLVEIAYAKGEELLPAKLIDNTTVVDIRIDQLHGTRDGKAMLIAYWWLRRDNEVISLHRFSESKPLSSSGYSALVDAQELLLTDLAGRIAASLEVPPGT